MGQQRVKVNWDKIQINVAVQITTPAMVIRKVTPVRLEFIVYGRFGDDDNIKAAITATLENALDVGLGKCQEVHDG